MSDQELIDLIKKHYEETGCMKCALWDVVAKEHGKRGICEECFNKNYVPLPNSLKE